MCPKGAAAGAGISHRTMQYQDVDQDKLIAKRFGRNHGITPMSAFALRRRVRLRRRGTRAARCVPPHGRRPPGGRPRLHPAHPDLGPKPLLAKLREQQPDLAAGNKEVREALAALKAEKSKRRPPPPRRPPPRHRLPRSRTHHRTLR